LAASFEQWHISRDEGMDPQIAPMNADFDQRNLQRSAKSADQLLLRIIAAPWFAKSDNAMFLSGSLI
jgi:hypothetical protein